ncbi:MAG TPA: hypothetical protein VG434_06335, partial [Sphingomicrobium sp.]|nr:hypothetical protein [Sphingomicrobium sp.]
MAQRPLLTASTIPLAKYPEEKNCRKKKQQINRDERGETDSDHGARSVGPGGSCRSFPNSKLAVAQVMPGEFVRGG